MVLKALCGKSNGKVVGSSNGFRSKMSGNMRVKHNGAGHLKKCAIFPFCRSVLLRCIRTRCLMYEAFLFKKLFNVRINVFSTINGSEHAGLGLKLGTDHIIELNKHMRYFRFLSKEVNPTHAGTIINKYNKV